jgi:anti-sigma factor RsiW
MVGGGLGYLAGSRPGMKNLAQETGVGVDTRDWLDDVVAHYRLYIHQPNRLIEIGADRPADILEWLTTGTGVGFRIPDLKQSGLTFVGARLFAAAGQPFGLLLYRRGDDGEVIALTFSKSRPETSKPVEDIRSDTGIVTWSTPLATYTIVGPSSAADLDDIAAKAAGLI